MGEKPIKEWSIIFMFFRKRDKENREVQLDENKDYLEGDY